MSAAGLLRKTRVEDRVDAIAHEVIARYHSRAAGYLVEFVTFGLKQAWACLFGGLILGLILVTRFFYPDSAPLARYDFLFLCVLTTQVLMLALRLENRDEAVVILVFHVIGTAMEVFKTHAGSWIYPEANFFRIGGVPLFSGFMYAAVGSYLARVWRIFDMRFTNYPPRWATCILATLIYVNFFSHHYLPDIRLALFGAVGLLYVRTRVHYRVFKYRLWMPMIVGFLLVSLFIWFGENLGTLSRAWLYPNQLNGWKAVDLSKLGSWFLLMIISFVLVTLVHKPTEPVRLEAAKAGQVPGDVPAPV